MFELRLGLYDLALELSVFCRLFIDCRIIVELFFRLPKRVELLLCFLYLLIEDGLLLPPERRVLLDRDPPQRPLGPGRLPDADPRVDRGRARHLSRRPGPLLDLLLTENAAH